jgi:hypothetical protein
VRNDWQGTEIKELVYALARTFGRPHRFQVPGRPQAAVEGPCDTGDRLCARELSTNAGKYGALSTDTGRVAPVGVGSAASPPCAHDPLRRLGVLQSKAWPIGPIAAPPYPIDLGAPIGPMNPKE